MKKNQVIIAVAVIVVVVFAVFLLRRTDTDAQKAREWSKKEPLRVEKREQRVQTGVDRFLEQLAISDPATAERLQNLRESDPNQFNIELGKAMREEMAKRMSETQQKILEGDVSKPATELPAGDTRRLELLKGPGSSFPEWLKENYPEKAKELAELSRTNPTLYRQKMQAAYQEYNSQYLKSRTEQK